MAAKAIRLINAGYTVTVTSGSGPIAEAKSIAEAHGFTSDEKEVFDLLLRGKLGAAIAHELQISESAVSWRCRKIMRKLHVSSRGEVIRQARDWDQAILRLLAGAWQNRAC